MKYLTVKDLTQMFNLPERRARALIKSEGLPSIKIGNTWYIEEMKLKEYLEANRLINLGNNY